LGLDEFALGQWIEADRHLQEVLARSSDPWIRKNQAVLRDALDSVRSHLGDLEILGRPVGAEVVVEGEVRGKLPLEKAIRVRVGPCRVDVRAPHHLPLTRNLEIAANALTRETVSLSPDPAPVAALTDTFATSHPTAVSAARLGVESPVGVTASPAKSGIPALRIVGLAIAGVGVAAVGTGLFLGLKARSAGRSDSKASSFDEATDKTGHRYETLQYVGYGIGAALLVGGAVAFFLSAPKAGQANDPMVALSGLVGGGAMAQVSGRF
jgi:hypothetical protein